MSWLDLALWTRRSTAKVSGQFRNLRACFGLGDLQVVARLQSHPAFGLIAEPVSETERRVARNGTLAVHDLRDPVRWHLKLPRQLGRCYTKHSQLLRQDFAWVVDRSTRGVLLSGAA